jgi:hypothetical protein
MDGPDENASPSLQRQYALEREHKKQLVRKARARTKPKPNAEPARQSGP